MKRDDSLHTISRQFQLLQTALGFSVELLDESEYCLRIHSNPTANSYLQFHVPLQPVEVEVFCHSRFSVEIVNLALIMSSASEPSFMAKQTSRNGQRGQRIGDGLGYALRGSRATVRMS